MKKVFFGFFFLFFSFLASIPLFARELSSDEEEELSYIRNLAFEINRYNMTGFSILPEAAPLANISKFSTLIVSRRKVSDSVQKSVYLLEAIFPDKTGIIDSTLTPETLYGISDSTSDFGSNPSIDWIDLLIQSLNAPTSSSETGEIADVTDGSKILEMLENGDDRGIEAPDEGKVTDEAPKEYSYIKEDGSLRRFSYDGEQFTVWQDGDETVVVNYYGEKVIRKYFDPLFRLSKFESFKTAPTAKKMSIENEIKYEYSDESVTPSKSIEEQFSAKKRLENHYDENGRSIYLLESHYEERELKSKGKKKSEEAEKETVLVDDKKTSKTYDASGRVIEEESVNWNYKKLLSGKYSKSESSTKNVYDYSSVTEENNLPPDFKFFEDGELHLERKYKNSDSYSEKLYFEGGFSVEVIFEGGMKTTEIIYLNNKEQRRRNFEY